MSPRAWRSFWAIALPASLLLWAVIGLLIWLEPSALFWAAAMFAFLSAVCFAAEFPAYMTRRRIRRRRAAMRGHLPTRGRLPR